MSERTFRALVAICDVTALVMFAAAVIGGDWTVPAMGLPYGYVRYLCWKFSRKDSRMGDK